MHKKPSIQNFILIFFFVTCFTVQAQNTSSPSVGVIGDNSALGPIAGREGFDHMKMWQTISGQRPLSSYEEETQEALKSIGLNGEAEKKRSPKILWPSKREFSGPIDWVLGHIYIAFSRLYVEKPSLAWGYLMGKKLGAEDENILIAANNQAKVTDIPRQMDRILEETKGYLPEYIIIFFAYGDLCAPNMNLVPNQESYQSSLERGLRYIFLNGKSKDQQKTKIILASYPPTVQILSQPNKIVYANGKELSCKVLKQQSYQASNHKELENKIPAEGLYLTNFLTPGTRCQTLAAPYSLAKAKLGLFSSFNKVKEDSTIKKHVEEHMSELAGIVRQYKQGAKQAVENISAWAQKEKKQDSVELSFVDMHEINFKKSDLAEDCFNLSVNGSSKIVNHIYSRQFDPNQTHSSAKSHQ